MKVKNHRTVNTFFTSIVTEVEKQLLSNIFLLFNSLIDVIVYCLLYIYAHVTATDGQRDLSLSFSHRTSLHMHTRGDSEIHFLKI